MANPGCDQCLYFRPKRRLDLLLKIPTHRVTPAPKEIREREVQLEDEESQIVIELLKMDSHWTEPPQVLPYCGLEEERRTYFAYESKNAGGRCEDFVPSVGAPRVECESCAHRDEAAGPARDRAEMAELAGMSRGMGS